jgi:hypothetical protein
LRKTEFSATVGGAGGNPTQPYQSLLRNAVSTKKHKFSSRNSETIASHCFNRQYPEPQPRLLSLFVDIPCLIYLNCLNLTMSKAFGFAANVIAVIQITGSVLSLCLKFSKYCGKVKGARKSIVQLASTVSSIKAVVDLIQVDLENENIADRLPLLQSLCEKDGPLELCRQTLADIETKLLTKRQHFTSLTAMTWPWKSEEFEGIINSLKKYETAITLALHGDTAKLMLSIQNTVKDIHEAVYEGKDAEIIKWLAKADPTSNHTAAKDKRTEGTGNWFLTSHQFSQWMRPRQSLWLNGIPGAGKTVLCSTIVESVRTRCQRDSVRCAFFYFDSVSGDTTKQMVTNMVSSFLVQLSTTSIHSEVRQLYKRCHDGSRTPSLNELSETFFNVVSNERRVYLIVDALDECCECSLLLTMLEKILKFDGDINLLVTSRKVHDIESALSPLINVEVSMEDVLVDPDISLHVEKVLREDPKLRRWNPAIKQEIVKELVSRANGMYVTVSYWVELTPYPGFDGLYVNWTLFVFV